MIPQHLIERALVLTGKTRDDMMEIADLEEDCMHNTYAIMQFSIEKFCYYLLSESFIEKYSPIAESKKCRLPHVVHASNFGEAIYEYQSEDEQPLISLLEKIG